MVNRPKIARPDPGRPKDMLNQMKVIAKSHGSNYVQSVRLEVILGEGASKVKTIAAALRLYTAYVTDVLHKPAVLPPEKMR